MKDIDEKTLEFLMGELFNIMREHPLHERRRNHTAHILDCIVSGGNSDQIRKVMDHLVARVIHLQANQIPGVR